MRTGNYSGPAGETEPAAANGNSQRTSSPRCGREPTREHCRGWHQYRATNHGLRRCRTHPCFQKGRRRFDPIAPVATLSSRSRRRGGEARYVCFSGQFLRRYRWQSCATQKISADQGGNRIVSTSRETFPDFDRGIGRRVSAFRARNRGNHLCAGNSS